MICPRCGKEYKRLLALSRMDNKTMICDQCGTEEALDDAGLMDGSQERKRILDNAYGSGSKFAPYESFETTHNQEESDHDEGRGNKEK